MGKWLIVIAGVLFCIGVVVLAVGVYLLVDISGNWHDLLQSGSYTAAEITNIMLMRIIITAVGGGIVFVCGAGVFWVLKKYY